MAAGLELQRRRPQRRGAAPAARQADARHQGRDRRRAHLHHPGGDLPRPGTGLPMTPRAHSTAAGTATGRGGGRRRASRRGGGGSPSPRGVALILVLTVIAILTSIGVDFSYNSRVSLKLAENARDGMRAYYLARSAVNLSRLLLHYQKQLDGAGAQLGGALQQVAGTLPGTPPRTGAGAPAAPSLGIRLW